MEQTEPKEDVVYSDNQVEETKEQPNADTGSKTPQDTPANTETGRMSLKRQKVGNEEGGEITVKSVKVTPKAEEKDKTEDQKDNKFKKKKLGMIVGYNGAEFSGSQKQGDVRTVEEELEKALYEQGMIDIRNYGDLKKIRFTRATRTDKRVHALQN